jgi:hypothetical protein
MKYETEKFGRKIVLDTKLIPGLPELTHEEFMLKTDANNDWSLLDENILIGTKKRIKKSDMEEIKENRGAYQIAKIFLVFWSDDIELDKEAIWLSDKHWMIVFDLDKEQNVYVPKYILHKKVYMGEE